MFANKKAWFSSSVSKEHRDFWLWECGILTGWRTADYLFSDDATHPDTLSVFNSEAYLWDKVTVFHSLFLSACEKRRSIKSVSIGHYVLPPVPVQDVRNVIGRFIWECEDNQPVRPESWTEPLHAFKSRDDPMNKTPTGISMEKLQTYSRQTHDSDFSGFQCIHCKAYICSPKS
uniref:telomere repeats-binding bouquet formation protein 2 isoform X2 n=1 Tax=Doryrhamphus excisus TaxID=161450 RepID=UPI0025AE7F90|nr:telomere repeats-binding bouquet formation protein 2 isoform X2 [Doryrhamphus excisus]